ncbi:hypothetical protein CR532_03975 [Candidatus Borreliella tachyglossi]|uniref:Uncharacterized protein n=1 Tax=Candidatus Borreliella tachyglossi TaxID=1964448 RepID=A0A2S1LXT4_9SPIR|nr:SDR family oxidoreductase [Candidatus Borreliella tachyglossi]AWG43108.1 hypothetical protein CR532_03975 [Candidatus Borreliella tachyglossi]
MSKIVKTYSTTILITAGTSKIGKILVKSLSTRFNIIFTYCSNENETTKLENLGNHIKSIKHDFLRNNNNKLFSKALDLSINNQINVLINNASIFEKSTLENFNDERFRNNLQINSLSALELGKQFLKQKLKNSSIINILDSSISYYNKNYFEYNLSKKLLFEITKALAYEGAPDTQVNGIAPGIIKSSGIKLNNNLKKRNLLLKFGKPSDILKTINFLIRLKFITGEVIFIDGGQSLKKGILNGI